MDMKHVSIAGTWTGIYFPGIRTVRWTPRGKNWTGILTFPPYTGFATWSTSLIDNQFPKIPSSFWDFTGIVNFSDEFALYCYLREWEVKFIFLIII